MLAYIYIYIYIYIYHSGSDRSERIRFGTTWRHALFTRAQSFGARLELPPDWPDWDVLDRARLDFNRPIVFVIVASYGFVSFSIVPFWKANIYSSAIE